MEHSSTMVTSPVEKSSLSSDPTASGTSSIEQTPSSDDVIGILHMRLLIGELREVCLYRYMTYNNIPENVNSFVRFFVLEAIKGLKTRESSKLVVHCSDGIGMSAVLVAIANGIESLAKRGSVDVYNIVKVLRNDRAGAVEQFDQYRFIYE
eukprot:gene8894-16521_t